MVDVESNRAAQRELYGAPLGEVLGRCRAALGLTQASLAAVLGISAPMLSQVMSANRIKIGNPTAVRRLQALVEVLDDVEQGVLEVRDALAHVESVGSAGDAWTSTVRTVPVRDTAAAVQRLFRSVAGADDHLAAAELLAQPYPEVARLLRVYGAGSLSDAVGHLSRVSG